MSNKGIDAADKRDSNNPKQVTAEDLGGKRALHVAGKELVIGADYDKLDVTYPSGTTEEYSYKKDAVEVFKIRVSYATASKNDLTTVEVI